MSVATPQVLPHSPSFAPHIQHLAQEAMRFEWQSIWPERVTLEHVDEFDWLPEHGVVLSKEDLIQVFNDPRALIDGTSPLDANRSHAVDIAGVLIRALEREEGQ